MLRVYLVLFPILALLGLGNCGILGGEDKEQPIVWEEESLERMVVYAYSYAADLIYIIDPATGHYETNTDFQTIYSVVTSKGGSLLYVSTGDGVIHGKKGSVFEVNPVTWERRKIYDRPVEFIHSTREEIFFVTKQVDDAGVYTDSTKIRILGKITPESGNVTEFGELHMSASHSHDYKAIQIHPVLPVVYVKSEKFQIYTYNYETRVRDTLLNGLVFSEHPNFTLSPNGDYLYFLGGPVIDTQKEEIVGFLPVFKWGHAAVRKDNKEVYTTDNGDFGLYNRPRVKNVNVYSRTKNALIDTIDVGNVTGMIFLSPKERYAFVEKRQTELIVVDLKNRAVVKAHDYEEIFTHTNISRTYLSTKPGANHE